MSQDWTRKEDAIVIKMRKEGATYKAISEVINRTDKAIACRVKVLRGGAPGRKKVLTRPDVNAFAIAELKAGASAEDVAWMIGAKFGLTVHADTVRNFRTREVPRALAVVVETPEPRRQLTEILIGDYVIPVTRAYGVTLSAGMVPA